MRVIVVLVICLYNAIETRLALREGYNWLDSTLRTLEFYSDPPAQRRTNKGWEGGTTGWRSQQFGIQNLFRNLPSSAHEKEARKGNSQCNGQSPCISTSHCSAELPLSPGTSFIQTHA